MSGVGSNSDTLQHQNSTKRNSTLTRSQKTILLGHRSKLDVGTLSSKIPENGSLIEDLNTFFTRSSMLTPSATSTTDRGGDGSAVIVRRCP